MMKTNILKTVFLVLSCSLFLQVRAVCTPDAITPQTQINGGAWEATGVATVASGGSVFFGPGPGWLPGSWSWSGPNGFTFNDRGLQLTNVQPNQSGNYVVTFINAGGCSSQYTFTLTVTSQCTPSTISPFTQINGGAWVSTGVATLAAGGSVYFGPAWLDGSWSWSGPNGFTASGRGLELTNVQPYQSGNYVVTFINAGGCSSQYTHSLTVTGLSTSTKSPNNAIVDVFPNPAIDFINVRNAKGADISIFDSMGKVVFKSSCVDDLTRVDVAGLFNGFYMIRAQKGKEIVTKKLVITK